MCWHKNRMWWSALLSSALKEDKSTRVQSVRVLLASVEWKSTSTSFLSPPFVSGTSLFMMCLCLPEVKCVCLSFCLQKFCEGSSQTCPGSDSEPDDVWRVLLVIGGAGGFKWWCVTLSIRLYIYYRFLFVQQICQHVFFCREDQDVKEGVKINVDINCMSVGQNFILLFTRLNNAEEVILDLIVCIFWSSLMLTSLHLTGSGVHWYVM